MTTNGEIDDAAWDAARDAERKWRIALLDMLEAAERRIAELAGAARRALETGRE
jgi:hypothetical protein